MARARTAPPKTHLEVKVAAHLCLVGAAGNVHLVAQQHNGHLLQQRLLQQLVQHALGLWEAFSVIHVNEKHYPAAGKVALLPVLPGARGYSGVAGGEVQG